MCFTVCISIIIIIFLVVRSMMVAWIKDWFFDYGDVVKVFQWGMRGVVIFDFEELTSCGTVDG